MLLLIDNYDSFTYNLYQYIGEMTPDIVVKRNDEITVEEIERMNPHSIVISPGPGHPADAGVTVRAIQILSGRIPILGICLGHQAIGLAFGGKIGQAKQIVHGKQSIVYNHGTGIFKNVPSSFKVVRYHSLCIKDDGFPECLELQAFTEDGTLMGIKHKVHPTFGLQFHPESILSEYGKVLLKNFLEMAEEYRMSNYLLKERLWV